MQEQIELLESGLMKPLRDGAAMCDKVKRNEMSIDEFVLRSEEVSRQVEGLLKREVKDGVD